MNKEAYCLTASNSLSTLLSYGLLTSEGRCACAKNIIVASKISFMLFALLIGFAFIHEFTHVALNNFGVTSFCLLNCESMNTIGILGNNYTPLGVQLTEPSQPLAKNESVANLAGLGFLCLVTGGIVIISKNKSNVAM